jgi:xylulokinase
MPPQLILAHDLGTTGDKATLFAPDGTVVASTFASYETTYAQPNWAEQDPAGWQAALFESTRRLVKRNGGDVAVVSFSGHMNGALAVDDDGTPLRPAIIWADQRAVAEAELIRQRCGDAETYALTGNRISPAYTAAKVLWIKEHQPDLFRRTHKILQAKDYAAFLLTGVLATDTSDASLTLLLDLHTRHWAEPMFERLELDPALLPDPVPSATVIGAVTPAAAAATGLRAGTPVVIGGGDGACATVGAGSVRPGQAYNYLGSSSWVALATAEPVLDPTQRTFNLLHLDPDLYVALGTMQTAGGALDWFERLVHDAGQDAPTYAELDAAAAEVAPGGGGLLFLPYLMGERSPYWNPQARGAFVGLAMPDGRGALARAVMEGVAFNLRHILEVLVSQGVAVDSMRLIGGGGKSTLWRQILADIYGRPIAQLDLPAQATALGAAIAGGVGVGIYADYGVAQNLAPVARVNQPDPVAQARYEPLYTLFKDTYVALEPIFARLAQHPDTWSAP